MLKSCCIESPDVSRRRDGILTILILLSAVCAAVSANAVEVPSLYTAQVMLDERADDPRSEAYEMALAEVLLRVSGSELGADAERVERLFPDPAAYVVQFRPGDKDTLWVSFDGRAIEKTLRQAGQTVWGSDRPLTLIWLAVDWGQGDREIIAADDATRNRNSGRSINRNRLLRERVLEVAERRGLPVAFPLLDTQDLQSVSFSDIWGGFDDALLQASKRYDVQSILVGRVRPRSSQRNRWSYYLAGEERTWSGEPEQVLGSIADLLAAEFAISGDAPIEFVELNIDGIDSIEAYGAVQNLLSNLRVIENFSIAEVSGAQVRYRVEARGGTERLRRALRFNGLIEQNGFNGDPFPNPSLNASLDFFYSAE